MANPHLLVLGLLVFFSSLCDTAIANRTCYGNVDDLHPSGDGSTVQSDMRILNMHRRCYEHVAEEYCIQASVIAAIASRESRAGRLLIATNGYGDNRNAWGVMQCDLRTSGLPCRQCDWWSCCHIRMMVGRVLIPFIQEVGRRHPSWPAAHKLQGGVAAYNFGPGNVRTWSRLDVGTTGNNYSNDVIARAKYLRDHGWY